MGFLDRIKRGWSLTKASFEVLGQDKEILLLPVMSFLAMVVGVGFWLGAGFFTVGPPGESGDPVWYVVGFLTYVTIAFVGTFFLAATIEMAMIRLGGGDPAVKDGLAKAWEKKGILLAWAVVAATVGILLRALRDRARGITDLLIRGLEVGWAVATFFAVPILVYQGVGPIEAIKRSVKEVKATWGEAAAGVVSTGVIFFLLGLVGLIPLALAFAVGSGTVLLLAIVVVVAYWIVLAAANTAVDGILRAALYRYAETGELPERFDAARA